MFHCNFDPSRSRGLGLLLITAALLGGCRKAPEPTTHQPVSNPAPAALAEPQAGPPEQPSIPVESSPPAPAPSAAGNAPPVVAPPPVAATPAQPPSTLAAQNIVIPAGTQFSVRLGQELGSGVSQIGDRFDAALASPIRLNGHNVVASHTAVTGKVIDAKAAGKFAGASSLALRMDTLDGRNVVTSTYRRSVDGKGKRTGLIIGGSAVAGALIGGLAGHGKGAAIGALAGGGAGTLGASQTGNDRDILLPAGTLLTFRLRQSLTIAESH